MDTSLYQSNLALALNDTAHATWSTSALQTIMCLSVRAYNRYRPLLRSYGTGQLYAAADALATEIKVVGGPFWVGQTLTVQSSYASQEFTVTDIAAGSQTSNWMGFPTALTVAEAVQTGGFAAGSLIGPSSPGLPLVAGQSNYMLPLDFVKFDQTSWDLANGSRGQLKAVESFYDGAYAYSQLLSQVGYGQAQTFNSGNFGPGPYLVGVPDATGALSVPVMGSSQVLIEVLTGNIPMLRFTPAPTFDQTWVFAYYATNQPESVPDADMDALVDAGRQVATQMTLQSLSGLPDLRDVDQEYIYSEAANVLVKVAEEAINQFDIKIRKAPFMRMGATRFPYFLCRMFGCPKLKRQKRSESIKYEM